jgi:hypothetical protein
VKIILRNLSPGGGLFFTSGAPAQFSLPGIPTGGSRVIGQAEVHAPPADPLGVLLSAGGFNFLVI